MNSTIEADRRPHDRRLLLEIADGILLAGALAFVFVFLATAAIRLTSPFAIGQLDAGFLQHVRRVLHGEPLYPAPSLAFVPFQYPPLYYYVSAAAARFAGDSYLPLRAVSLVCSLLTLGLIAQFVRKETTSLRYGIIAACLFAATYRIVLAWFDRPGTDMLYCAAGRQSTIGSCQARSPARRRRWLMILFLTKQTASSRAGIVCAACRTGAGKLSPSACCLAQVCVQHSRAHGPTAAGIGLCLSAGCRLTAWDNLRQFTDFWLRDLLQLLLCVGDRMRANGQHDSRRSSLTGRWIWYWRWRRSSSRSRCVKLLQAARQAA